MQTETYDITVPTELNFRTVSQGTEVYVYTNDTLVFVYIHLGSRTFNSTNTAQQVGNLTISGDYAPPLTGVIRASNVGGIELGIAYDGKVVYINTRSSSVTTAPSCVLLYPKKSAIL